MPASVKYRAAVSLCKDSFWDFIQHFWECIPGAGTLVPNWHMEFLAEELQKLAVRVFHSLPLQSDLVINVPPGTSKSSLVSVLFPAWVWTFMPHARFLCASHTDSLVQDLADRCKSVIESEKYRSFFPHVRIRKDKSAKEDFANTAGGERKSCTVGGKSPTGRHSHFLLLDDCIDPQRALSEAELKIAADFITMVIPSRKVNKDVTPTILVMQRLHFRDPTAVMLEVAKRQGAFPVRHVCFPGELVRGDDGAFLESGVSPPELIQKYRDGLLDPVRLSRRVLNDYKARLGPYAFAGQILQMPLPPGGGLFKPEYFTKIVKSAPYNSLRVRFWDRGASSGAGCPTAGVLMARSPDGLFYVEDVVHGQWDPKERNDVILATAIRDRSRYEPNYAPLIVIEGERGSTGLEAYQALAAKLAGFPVFEDLPTGSKDTRAEPWSAVLAAGIVYMVNSGWDLDGFIQEHLLFMPDYSTRKLGRLKDRVDACSGAFARLLKCQLRTQIQVRSLRPFDYGRGPGLRIIACTKDDLLSLDVENRHVLLVVIENPPIPGVYCADTVDDGMSALNNNGTATGEVGHATAGLKTGTANGAVSPFTSPPHSLAHVLETVHLRFADVLPQDYQDNWGQPVHPWGVPAEELVMNSAHGKKLWSALTRKRDPAVEVLVVCDDGDRRAVSVAVGVAKTLGKKDGAIFRPSCETNTVTDNEMNSHVLAITRSSRGMVV